MVVGREDTDGVDEDIVLIRHYRQEVCEDVIGSFVWREQKMSQYGSARNHDGHTRDYLSRLGHTAGIVNNCANVLIQYFRLLAKLKWRSWSSQGDGRHFGKPEWLLFACQLLLIIPNPGCDYP